MLNKDQTEVEIKVGNMSAALEPELSSGQSFDDLGVKDPADLVSYLRRKLGKDGAAQRIRTMLQSAQDGYLWAVDRYRLYFIFTSYMVPSFSANYAYLNAGK